MPPRRAQPTQQHDDDEAGPSNRPALPEYVTMTLAQTMIAEGFMPETDFKAMVHRLTKTSTDAVFRSVLSQLQQEVHFLDVGIERVRLPANGNWYVCLVDKERDEASKQMGSKYGPDATQFARAVVEAISSAQAPEGRLLADVSQIDLLNLDVRRPAAASQAAAGGTQAAAAAAGGSEAGAAGAAGAAARGGRKLSHTEKLSALRSFAADGWLHEERAGFYTLGPRTLSELKDLVLDAVTEEIADRLRQEYL